jgi:hypothetical protein
MKKGPENRAKRRNCSENDWWDRHIDGQLSLAMREGDKPPAGCFNLAIVGR